MSKRFDQRVSRIRETSVKGLRPGTVFSLTGIIMLCAFVLAAKDADVESRDHAANVVEQIVPADSLDMTRFGPREQRRLLLLDEDALLRETLWLARCIYSESHRMHEQELVAWVVRNRVETRYRGEATYRDVVTDPFQFSAFNRYSPTRDFLLALDTTFTGRGWLQALEVADRVIRADVKQRPFPITTRHFYSERSLGDSEIPIWSLEMEPIEIERFRVDERRFRFFDGVS